MAKVLSLHIAAPVRERGDLITRTPFYSQLPTDAPTRARIFFDSGVTRVSQETRLVKELTPTSLFYEEAICKSSTKKGLLYAPYPEEHKKRTLSDQPQLSRVTSMALLCH
jgi:hypothetical protein